MVALVVGGCAETSSGTRSRSAGSSAPGGASADAGDYFVVVSAAGTWRVAYRTEPSPIPLNEPFSVFVRVAPSGSIDYSPDIPIRVDAGMPHHQHGMNRVPEHQRIEPDLVRADGLLFHMPGDWTLTFDVTQGAITERAEVVVAVP